MLELKNTLTKTKERFKPLKQNEVKIYFCWPTVYNFVHIWNLRTFVFEDYVIKTLKFLWYKTKTVMNITDIDDKTIRNSQLNNEKLSSFTQKYTNFFLEDLKKLNIEKADNIVPISSLIDEMVDIINKLLKKWYAYLWDDWSIYFDIKKFKNYWKFAWIDFSWIKESVRINNDEYDKENPWDFVLWKAWKKEDWENFWEKEFVIYENNSKASPELKIIKKIILKWRPGWHIECSACNMKYFWPQIDIHMWWVDLIFPHHQNEIAQIEAVTWKTFSKYWLHSGHLMVDGKKMSKSLNNFYTLRDIEEKYKNIDKSVLYRAIRLSFLSAKYSESVDFSFKKLESNINTILRIDESLKKLNAAIKSNKLGKLKTKIEFRQKMQYFIWNYVRSLEDDFNIPEALSVFFEFLTYSNKKIDSLELSIYEAESLFEMFKTFDSVFSFLDFEILEQEDIPKEIMDKFIKRNEAKAKKDFEIADRLRDELMDLWYRIIDDRTWSRIEKIS